MNTPISFEIAKLLKEKDFKEHVNNYFGNNGREEHFQPNYKANYNSALMVGLTHSRPIIADVVIWLYEKHGFWIYSRYFSSNYFYGYVIDSNGDMKEIAVSEINAVKFNSPTEAYEAAVLYCLKNLI
jgi:hypothetical protein